MYLCLSLHTCARPGRSPRPQAPCWWQVTKPGLLAPLIRKPWSCCCRTLPRTTEASWEVLSRSKVDAGARFRQIVPKSTQLLNLLPTRALSVSLSCHSVCIGVVTPHPRVLMQAPEPLRQPGPLFKSASSTVYFCCNSCPHATASTTSFCSSSTRIGPLDFVSVSVSLLLCFAHGLEAQAVPPVGASSPMHRVGRMGSNCVSA